LDRGAPSGTPRAAARQLLILVVCALRAELRTFAPRPGVDVLECGVGPVEAAAVTARALAGGRYEAALNAGIGGAFRGRVPPLKVGDALLVAEEYLADLGLEGGETLTLPDGAQLFERARASAALLKKCSELPLRVGRGLTVSQVTATQATAERFERRYGADVESMEGFSFLRAAELAGVEALEIRGISNYVGDRYESEWDFVAGARATVAALNAVLDCLATPGAEVRSNTT
jgi:futalosine hydrolase